MESKADQENNKLIVIPMGIDTYKENILYLRHDSDICRSEGFSARTRVVVHHGHRSIVATINAVTSEIIHHNEAGLSTMAYKNLGVNKGDVITVSHLMPLESMSFVRAKLYGKKLDSASYSAIINDITKNLYSDIELSAFISGCAGDNMDIEEIVSLTNAMIKSGNELRWNRDIVLDKHSIGGLPGNRTTPIIVAIVAAADLTIPKTSSYAITSPAGTADTMSTLTNVNLSIEQLRNVIDKENGCLAWGGSVYISPADDILITVERALDIDSSGQMIASVLSKKAAAGSTHVLIEIPVGKTAKVRLEAEALKLKYYFEAVAKAIRLQVKVMITNGDQPIGRGIGPALEAKDVLKVLRNEKDAPADLKMKSIEMAAMMFEMTDMIEKGSELQLARSLLESGAAYEKFQRICNLQGAFKVPPVAAFEQEIVSDREGLLTEFDNRKLAKAAKLAGAPEASASGILLHVKSGDLIKKNQLLYTVYAETKGELNYAVAYIKQERQIITIK